MTAFLAIRIARLAVPMLGLAGWIDCAATRRVIADIVKEAKGGV